MKPGSGSRWEADPGRQIEFTYPMNRGMKGLPADENTRGTEGEFLLIDVGNTRVKMALADRAGILRQSTMLTSSVTSSAVRTELDRLGWTYERVLLCSVVPRVNGAFKGLGEVAVLDAGFDLGFAIDYPDPEGIGADRLANAAALASTGPVPGLVIDFGTAVTFDIIDHRPAYVGGVIAPGLGMSTDYLAERTALLPRIELPETEPPWIGRDTEAAMLSGAYHGFTGMIVHLTRGLSRQLTDRAEADGCEGRVRVLATGGDANLILAQGGFTGSIFPDLTIEGLRFIACRRWTC